MGKYSGYHTLYGTEHDRTGIGVMVIVKTPDTFDLNTIDRSAAIKLVQDLMEKLERRTPVPYPPATIKPCCPDPSIRGGRCYNCGEWREELCVVTK